MQGLQTIPYSTIRNMIRSGNRGCRTFYMCMHILNGVEDAIRTPFGFRGPLNDMQALHYLVNMPDEYIVKNYDRHFNLMRSARNAARHLMLTADEWSI
jgi:hypothetical protein